MRTPGINSVKAKKLNHREHRVFNFSSVITVSSVVRIDNGGIKVARIAGIDLPKNKRAEIGLTYVFGIGRSLSRQILSRSGVNFDTKVKDLTDEEIAHLRGIIEKDYKVEGDLRREVANNIKRLMDIGSYRGLRHRKGLPVRGQRSRTNARTRKGPRRGVGAKKRKTATVGAGA